MANETCPICSSPGAPHYAAGGFRFYKCDFCSSGFVDPMPEDAWLTQFYSRFHMSLDEGGGYEKFESRRLLDFNSYLVFLKRRLTGGLQGRLLDVGCGKGIFADFCRKQGFEVKAIDLSDVGIECAKSLFNLDAECISIENYSKKYRNYFDVVTFMATIEHLRDPVCSLAAIKLVLKPGGVLLLDTGIGGDFIDGLLPGVNQWFDPPQHLYVFSRLGIKLALRKAGFDEIYVDPYFERSPVRKIIKITRNFLLALGYRFVSVLGGAKSGPFQMTKFPLGNLMVVTAIAKP